MSYWPSKTFKREEFACNCAECADKPAPAIDYGLVRACEAIRAHFDTTVYITSGFRCEAHNAAVGGSEHSQHLLGRAADLVVKDVPAHLVAELARDMELGGVGEYETFTHIDTREGQARWNG